MIQKRYWEIDCIRGIAIILMITFHTLYDLQFLFNKNIFTKNNFWSIMPYCISGIFLTISGITLSINYQRKKYSKFTNILYRSSKIFLLGIIITLTTIFFDFGGKIYFGILHCISLATLLSYFFKHTTKKKLLFLGLIFLTVGIYVDQKFWIWHNPYFFWLFPYYNFSIGDMIDYYPLIPSFGFILLGLYIGKIFYKKTTKKVKLPIYPYYFFTKPLQYIGKYSLWIYMLHQPIIYFLLNLLV